MDCYSESGDHNSREAEVNDSKKQPVKEDCCISLDVPRLEDTTVSLETSSNVSVVNCDMFSGSEERGTKRQCEERHTSGSLKKRSLTRTTISSEVLEPCSVNVNDISECGGGATICSSCTCRYL